MRAQAGSTFFARMMTVVTSLKSQQRDVLEFLTQAVHNAREAKQTPCLLPELISPNNNEQDFNHVA